MWVGGMLVWCANVFTSQPNQNSGQSRSPSISVYYLDSTNANNPVPLSEVNQGLFGVGLFNLLDNCPGDGSPVDYVFRITNSGSAPLNGIGSSPVSATLLNRNAFVHGTTNDFTVNITSAPTFPVAPGNSTTFTVRLNYNANGGNDLPNDCGLGWITPEQSSGGEMSTVRVRLSINTNDPSYGTYSPEVTVWGVS